MPHEDLRSLLWESINDVRERAGDMLVDLERVESSSLDILPNELLSHYAVDVAKVARSLLPATITFHFITLHLRQDLLAAEVPDIAAY